MEGIDEPTAITTSIGAVLVQPGVTSLTDALESADQALYQAKRSGRNRVVQADG